MLLIACVNVANLLLAKAGARVREIAVRTALGAGRGRIVAQLLTESMLIACFGGAAGIAIGAVLLDAVVALAPAALTDNADIRMDREVLLFAAGISVASCLVFGLVPALRTFRIDVNEALKNSAGQSTTAPRVPRVIVAAEIGLATMLAVAAGLVIQTFGRLATTKLGFETRDVLVAQAAPMYSPQPEGAERNVRWHRDSAEELRRLPGVLSVAGVVGFP